MMLSALELEAFEVAVVKSRQCFIARLLHRPIKYVKGNGYFRLIYPFVKKPWVQDAQLFFNKTIKIPLPAGLDLYLLGIKTHHSEIRLSRMLFRYMCPGEVFIDVGAHVGYFSLLAARLVGKQGRVFAFEASSSIIHFLKQNVTDCPNITVYHKAVSARDEMVTMKEFPILFSEYNTISKPHGIDLVKSAQPYLEKTVDGITLNDFLQKEDIIPDWIKIDVEGSERDVIEGLLPFLEKESPRIIMEYIPGQYNAVYVEAIEMLVNKDYLIFLIDNTGLLKQTNLSHLGLLNTDSENIVLIRNVD